MAYVYERFAAVTLPIYNRETNLSPVPAANEVVSTLAGAFDAVGQGRSRQKYPNSLSVKCVVTAASAAAWRTALDQLRALVGTRGKLYRRGDDNALHTCIARLVAMPHTRSVEHKAHIEVTLQFLQLTAWIGDSHASWALDNGELLDSGLFLDPATFKQTISASPSTQTVTNGGNLPQTDVVFVVTAGSGALSNIVIGAAGVDLRYNATLAAGSTLVIDCAAQAVLVNGGDAYSAFTLGPTHTKEDWCELAPGSTAVSVYASGTLTGSSWTIEFADRWA